MSGSPGHSLRSALLAFQFLTRLPVPGDHYDAAALAASPRWYPAVGTLIGALLAASLVGFGLVFSPMLAALLTLAAGLLLTGALHEDGFADLCDGLGGGRDRGRALEIMRDSRIGAYGALGLIVLLGLRVVSLSDLDRSGAWVAAGALIAAHAASRGAIVWVLSASAYAREDGAGNGVAGPRTRGDLIFAFVCSCFAVIPLAVVMGLAPVLAALVLLTVAVLVVRRLFEQRLGGYTGDCLGAVQQVGEIAFYLGLLAWV
jgi:adenosylcobinamide-GDP ribazoletransferase